MKPFSRTLLPLACVALFGSAHAQTTPNVQTSPWSLAVGAVHLGFNTKADLYAGGPVPGAGVDASSDTIAGLEIAYSFNPNWTRLGWTSAHPSRQIFPARATSGL
ncbi:hypothetical protein [Acidovorax sp. KKS102]|uniref:hypothetical protein n=1 Tax=Acidovorax sp. KKS102 TaxID=358220 RepID=UPI001EE68343|nr:hypothetical protein [Acidovorax sp. KKS102]